MHTETTYQGKTIILDTQEFANGWAIAVAVDGVTLLEQDDVEALFPSADQAIEAGLARARQYISRQQ
ncbi:MAG: hypothetical protein V4805_13875 [Pseudomonadota bacterium]